ncbi:MAG: thioredoxin domain-containing protein [Sandaracinaceae bacterium]|nr:thioredoxin domain-containing protein [Sandaracinaceae bacterium]
MRGALTIASCLVALVGCGGSQFGFDLPDHACRAAEGDARPWETRGYRLPVPDDAPRRGAARPIVVIQAFSDFECPHCAHAEPTMDRLLEEYGECLQVVWRNRPLGYHTHARLAARAGHEVYRQGGDAAFWRFHDLVFADQEHLERADLERHAAAVGGVDMAAFGAALDGDAHEEVIGRDLTTIDTLPGDQSLGTPTFFVNGTLVHGARRHAHFAYRVEEALADYYGTHTSGGPP